MTGAVLAYSGRDYDSYGVVRAGRSLLEGGLVGFDHSRNPGYFVHEVATGVLGGAFAAFVAPLVFNNVYEFPLALAV